MKTFKSSRTNHFPYIIKHWLITFGIATLPVIYDQLFNSHLIKDSYYYIVAAVLIARVYRDADTYRILQIDIDYDKQLIAFYYKTFFSGLRKRVLLFNNARLEVINKRAYNTEKQTPVKLYFFKNKLEIFEISNSKDGFSYKTIGDISTAIASIPLPATTL
ncbi:hypothetical protein [Foetidibacter luteolus]|uniref:hypothetical protein n=1 Tax=Foetidibacter luteolus TaxID=2608880 RepID=UPI00129AF3A9|nr:hypothetical protein [Foetidibacter luteolus]